MFVTQLLFNKLMLIRQMVIFPLNWLFQFTERQRESTDPNGCIMEKWFQSQKKINLKGGRSHSQSWKLPENQPRSVQLESTFAHSPWEAGLQSNLHLFGKPKQWTLFATRFSTKSYSPWANLAKLFWYLVKLPSWTFMKKEKNTTLNFQDNYLKFK